MLRHAGEHAASFGAATDSKSLLTAVSPLSVAFGFRGPVGGVPGGANTAANSTANHAANLASGGPEDFVSDFLDLDLVEIAEYFGLEPSGMTPGLLSIRAGAAGAAPGGWPSTSAAPPQISSAQYRRSPRLNTPSMVAATQYLRPPVGPSPLPPLTAYAGVAPPGPLSTRTSARLSSAAIPVAAKAPKVPQKFRFDDFDTERPIVVSASAAPGTRGSDGTVPGSTPLGTEFDVWMDGELTSVR
jgi:hypothetical protein